MEKTEKTKTWAAKCKTCKGRVLLLHYGHKIDMDALPSSESETLYLNCEGENPEKTKHFNYYNFPGDFKEIKIFAGIDIDFWLNFAKGRVSQNIENIEKDADKLDTFLIWTWGIYTTIFALASIFDFLSSNIWQLLFMALPILIIMLSRYLCTMVSLPSPETDKISANPNDVPSIVDSYNFIITDKKKKLKVAQIFTLISIFSIMIALVSYSYLDPNKDIKQEIKVMKLKKNLSEQEIVEVKAQKQINDSINSLNEYYGYRIQNILLQRKLKCIENDDTSCFKAIKLFEK
jgi:hypothetical protein